MPKVVFFVIEGVIKADAVLTYILKHDLKASVFDVPAVWQWDARELAEFARPTCSASEVCIVADADGYRNLRGVMTPARLCQMKLKELGIFVYIALPPARTRRKYKGVDDFLAGGGRLEDLEITKYRSKAIWGSAEVRRDRALSDTCTSRPSLYSSTQTAIIPALSARSPASSDSSPKPPSASSNA